MPNSNTLWKWRLQNPNNDPQPLPPSPLFFSSLGESPLRRRFGSLIGVRWRDEDDDDDEDELDWESYDAKAE